MPAAGHHPHGTTTYAPPVTCRAPSPASSIGTVYDDDATSDAEQEMSVFEFERFCEEKIKLRQPRPEEERAEREVLITDKARGAGGEAEQALVEKILHNLRAEVKILDEEEIYERAMMKGSQIGLELQPPTSDIDKIMRSMMHLSHNPGTDTQSPNPSNHQPLFSRASIKAPVTSGPWNNYGKKPTSLKSPPFSLLGLTQTTSERSSNSAAPTTSFASTTTAGTNTTMEDNMMVEHGLGLLLGSTDSGILTPPWPPSKLPPSKPNPGTEGGSTSDGTVVGGKRTRSGLARR